MTEEHQRRTTWRLKKAVKMSVYMKRLVVISLTLTLSHVMVHPAKVRHNDRGKPRPLTEKQKSDIVRKHNELRASEGAADMEMMTWNETLAARAADAHAGCGEFDTGYWAQNIMAVSGKPLHFERSIQYWYNKKSDYNLDMQGCSQHKHRVRTRALVFAKTLQVGCAYHVCDRVEHWNPRCRNVKVFECHYQPLGGWGEKPFKKGPACSKCGGGAGWCKDGLCNSQCSKAGKDCTCKAICHNCATLNRTTCRCSCPTGWAPADCSERCEQPNKLKRCNPAKVTDTQTEWGWFSPPWYPSDCNHWKFGSEVRAECPVMCELCKPDPNAEAGKCPPIYAAKTAEAAKLVKKNSTDGDNDGNNGSHHQKQCIILALLSNVILSLTITWKALFWCTCTLSDSVWGIRTAGACCIQTWIYLIIGCKKSSFASSICDEISQFWYM